MDLFSVASLLLLSLFGCCAGQDILPEGPVDAVVGKNVTLKTLLDKPQYVFITWNYNDGSEQIFVATLGPKGVKVNQVYAGRASIDETNGALTLTALTTGDSGDYSINILSEDSTTRTAEISLKIFMPVSDVVIKPNVAEAIENNSTVILNCSAKGSFLTFTWTNGTAPIKADDKRLTIKNEEVSSTLTITDVLRSDLAGPIYCSAANKLEAVKSAPFSLTVYYGPETVIISPANPPEFIRSGSNFSLSCSASSSPPATFTWFHNQQPMEVTGPVLSLKQIEDHGLGNKEGFTCSAKNAKTERSVSSPTVSLAVMEPISGVSFTGPTLTLIAGNSSANLSCQASAGTVKTRTWLKDGKPLSAGPRLVFSANMSSVMIHPLQKEDNGEYTCQLANPVSSDRASYKMVVNFGPELVMVKGDSEVEVKDAVKLVCSAASVPPATYTWKFNGTLTGVKTAEYIMEAAVYKNTGAYTCEAHNAVTGKTSVYTHNLSVKEEGALDDSLSDGAIAGIVIAVLVALAAAIGVIVYCRQKVPVESPY